MVAHRKNVPAPAAYVPSSWFIVLTVLVVTGAGGWLGWLVTDDDPAPADTASPAAASSTATTPSPSATEESPAPDESPSPEEEPAAPDEETPAPDEETPAPATDRSATVSVLNNSGIVGAARAFSAKVTAAGWSLGGIGNWTGSIVANTVYYPAGLQSQAEVLARDVGIQRIRPSVAPMRTDRLTIILSGTP